MTLPCARVQRSAAASAERGAFIGGGAKQRGEAQVDIPIGGPHWHSDSGLYIKCAGIAKPGIAL